MLIRMWDTQRGEVDIQMPAAVGAGPPGGFPANQPVLPAWVGTVTTDPGTGQDSTQGYSVGSMVINTTAGTLRLWECRDASVGAAKWIFAGADYASGGTNPNNEVTQFGGAPTAVMAEEGNIFRQVSTAGIQPGSTGNDNVLAVYTLPANAFDIAGRGVNIQANGATASNTNAKRIKIIAGATTAVVGSAVTGGITIADSGVVNTTAASGGWCLAANIFKASVINTQLAIHETAQMGNSLGPLLAPSSLALTENGAIIIAVTGNATTATTDITYNFGEANAMNAIIAAIGLAAAVAATIAPWLHSFFA